MSWLDRHVCSSGLKYLHAIWTNWSERKEKNKQLALFFHLLLRSIFLFGLGSVQSPKIFAFRSNTWSTQQNSTKISVTFRQLVIALFFKLKNKIHILFFGIAAHGVCENNSGNFVIVLMNIKPRKNWATLSNVFGGKKAYVQNRIFISSVHWLSRALCHTFYLRLHFFCSACALHKIHSTTLQATTTFSCHLLTTSAQRINRFFSIRSFVSSVFFFVADHFNGFVAFCWYFCCHFTAIGFEWSYIYIYIPVLSIRIVWEENVWHWDRQPARNNERNKSILLSHFDSLCYSV